MAVMPPAYFKGDEMREIVFMFFRSRMGSQPLAGGRALQKQHHRKEQKNGCILKECQQLGIESIYRHSSSPFPSLCFSASLRDE